MGIFASDMAGPIHDSRFTIGLVCARLDDPPRFANAQIQLELDRQTQSTLCASHFTLRASRFWLLFLHRLKRSRYRRFFLPYRWILLRIAVDIIAARTNPTWPFSARAYTGT